MPVRSGTRSDSRPQAYPYGVKKIFKKQAILCYSDPASLRFRR